MSLVVNHRKFNLKDLLGDVLLLQNEEIPVDSILDQQPILGLYFSREKMTNEGKSMGLDIKEFYKKFKDRYRKKAFEIVFVSKDEEEDLFSAAYEKMPWPAVPWYEEQRRRDLQSAFNVGRREPMLVLIDTKTQQVLRTDGTMLVKQDPNGLEYPWKPNRSFREIIGDGPLIDGREKEYERDAVLKNRFVGLYFSDRKETERRSFVAALIPVYETLKQRNKNFEIILVSSGESAEVFDEYLREQPWLAVPNDDLSRIQQLKRKYHIDTYPYLIILDEEDNIVTEHGREHIYGDPFCLQFPWREKNVIKLTKAHFDDLERHRCLILIIQSEIEEWQIDESLGQISTEYKYNDNEILKFYYIVSDVDDDGGKTLLMRWLGLNRIRDYPVLIYTNNPSNDYYLYDGVDFPKAKLVQRWLMTIKDGTNTRDVAYNANMLVTWKRNL